MPNIHSKKARISKTIIPPLAGMLAVFIILLIADMFIYGSKILSELGSSSSINFYPYFIIPVTLIAILIQHTLTLPFWKKFKNHEKILGMKLIPFTILISLLGGIAFGLVFYETSYGVEEFLKLSLAGVLAFAIYWTCNLALVKRIENIRNLNHKQSNRKK